MLKKLKRKKNKFQVVLNIKAISGYVVCVGKCHTLKGSSGQ